MRRVLGVLCSVPLLLGCERREEPRPAVKSATVRIVHGPELRAYLSDLKERFYVQNPTLSDGTKITIELVSELGVVAARKLASGELKSEAWVAPSSSLVNLVNSSISGLGAEQVECQPLFTTPIVAATRPESREFFNTSTNRFSWREVFESKLAQASTAPDTNYLAYSHAAPESSVTGTDSLLLLAYLAANTAGPLTAEGLLGGLTLKRLERFEDVVSNYSMSEAFLLERTARATTKRIRFTLTSEQQLALYNVNRGPGAHPLIALYPEEGSVVQDYQFCVSKADWVTPAHQATLRLFGALLRGPVGREAATAKGFRVPESTGPLRAPLTPEFGVELSAPSKVFPPAEGKAVQALLEHWGDLKRPAALAVVLDNSGSMEGESLRLSKDFIRNLVARLPDRDKKGLVSFSTTAKVESKFSTDTGDFIRALDPIQSLGGSAVYDGIRTAIELIATSDLQSYRKSILVITDGQDKNSESSVQSLTDTINTKFSQHDVNLIIVAISREDPDFTDLERITRAANGLFREASLARLGAVFQEVQRNL
ncbi:MAG: hypothetical protein RL417_1933 [Pseudomonadota bacterium]